MAKQVGNLEVPEIFERWDNPLWVSEEADKYRNVVKDYGHDYFGNIYDKYSEEDMELYLSMPHDSITAMKIRLKYPLAASFKLLSMAYLAAEKI